MNSEGIEAIIESNLNQISKASAEGLMLARYFRAKFHNAHTDDSTWTKEHAHLAAEKILREAYVHISSLSSLHSVHLAVEFFRINPDLKSLHLPTMTTQQDPTPEPDEYDRLAAHIIAKPGHYDPNHYNLAKAYEAQRERIADLEDDVDRLRPREAFVPEVLFEYDSLNTKVLIDTDSGGGLCIDATDLVTDSNVVTMLTPEQSHQLTTALSKWAGTRDGVEWRPIGDPPSATLVGADFLLADIERVVTSSAKDSIYWWGDCKKAGFTHWAPLPKPPEAKS